MEEAVQGGGGHDGIAGEDLAPIAEGFVAGEDDAALGFVALADDLEEKAGLRCFQGEVADFIDDEKFGPGEVFHFAVEAVFGHGLGEAAGDIDGGGEVNAMAELGGDQAQADGQVGFADAGRTEEDEVAPFVKEASGGQFIDEPAVERRLGLELEVIEFLEIGEAGELEVEFDGAAMALGQFAIQQAAEKVAVGSLPGGGLLAGGVQPGQGDVESERFEPFAGFLFEHNGAHATSSYCLSGTVCTC